MLLVLLFLLLRNAGIYPLGFIDEWIDAGGARFLEMAQAAVPSYVYFALYGVTNSCGDSFMECNRLLNAVLHVGASPLIYLLARRVAPPWVAVLVAMAAALAPANALTPFFMPEAAYYFAFWLLCWALFRLHDRPGVAPAAMVGAIAGIAAMVKLHAIFLLPGAALFIAYATFAARAEGPRHGWLAQGVLLCAATGIAFAAARFGIGYLLAGKSGLHLFGELYATQASYTARSHQPYPQLALLALNNLRGQAMMLALLFGVPLAVLATHVVTLLRHGVRRDPAQAMAVLTLLMLGSALGVTVLFTASITGLGEQEVASRIHTRYYHFALPLLLLCGAGALGTAQREVSLAWRAAIGLAVAGFIVYAKLRLLHYFTPAIVDSPELLAVSLMPTEFRAIAAGGALAVLAWIVRHRLGAGLFTIVFLPRATLHCATVTAEQVRQSNRADTYTKAGLFARHFLTPRQTDRMVIVGPAIGGLHRARFYIENPKTALLELPAGTALDSTKLAPETRWVLALGDYPLPEGARVETRLGDIALARLSLGSAVGHELSFRGMVPDGYLQGVDGLSTPEAWGTWTEGPRATIRFAVPLPKRFRLTLAARAFGPNAGQPVTLAIGGQQRSVVVDGDSPVATVEFDDAAGDTLEIGIPQPASPKQLGQGEDLRLLGIGIEWLKVEEIATGENR
jgi:phosphoglycerol transferase